MALRRAHGFTRYLFSLQYHGGSFLGIAWQGEKGEDCVLPDGTDLRGLTTVEGRIRKALASLVGGGNYENIQVSSRTDRGVHALKNTFHVDIRSRKYEPSIMQSPGMAWDLHSLRDGLNFHLVQQASDMVDGGSIRRKRRRRRVGTMYNSRDPFKSNAWLQSVYRNSVENSLRILNVVHAPDSLANKFHTGQPGCEQPLEVDWNARFAATGRTYVYRILHFTGDERNAFVPFEYDRVWKISGDTEPLNIDAMNVAGRHLCGTHDFTSFRGRLCQRSSPIVTLDQVHVESYPYSQIGNLHAQSLASGDGGALDSGPMSARLYTVTITGESFLYRQVRNIVGCLIHVGQGKLTADDVQHILVERDRKIAPPMAPPHGLFLSDVRYSDVVL